MKVYAIMFHVVNASIAQLAECVLGKDEVTGSTPVGSSRLDIIKS